MLQETRVLHVSTRLHKQAHFMVRWQLEQKGNLLERLWTGQKNDWIHEMRLGWGAWAAELSDRGKIARHCFRGRSSRGEWKGIGLGIWTGRCLWTDTLIRKSIWSRDQPDMEGEVCRTEAERKFLSYNEGKSENQGGSWRWDRKTTVKVWSICDIESNWVKNEIVYIYGDLPLCAGNPTVSRSGNKRCFALWESEWFLQVRSRDRSVIHWQRGHCGNKGVRVLKEDQGTSLRDAVLLAHEELTNFMES